MLIITHLFYCHLVLPVQLHKFKKNMSFLMMLLLAVIPGCSITLGLSEYC